VLALLDPTSLVQSAGYAAIFLLSIAQSCCVPTSSELTLGFAGVLAAEGKLSLPGAIVAGVAGELIGAYIAWFIGRAGGRRFVDRFGKYILLTHHDLDRAEGWYRRHPRFGVFGSRLLPVIRNFVAVPAGVAEVPLLRFGILTALGSLLWDGAMALIGYGVGSNYKSVMHGFSDAGYVLGVAVVAAVAFVIYHRYRAYKAATAGGAHQTARKGGAGRGGSRWQAPAGGPSGRRPLPPPPVGRRPGRSVDPADTAQYEVAPAPGRPEAWPGN
jgi:membrane protein DedA with SNARE-associated domain